MCGAFFIFVGGKPSLKYLTYEMNCVIIILYADKREYFQFKAEIRANKVKREKKRRQKKKVYAMQIIEKTGKQKGYTVFSARRIPTGACGLISVGVKHAFSRKNSQVTGGVQ